MENQTPDPLNTNETPVKVNISQAENPEAINSAPVSTPFSVRASIPAANSESAPIPVSTAALNGNEKIFFNDIKTKPLDIAQQPAANPPSVKSEAGFFIPPGRSYKKLIIILVVAIAAVLLLTGAVWGFGKYETAYRKVALEKILPGNLELVARLTLDPQSKQFQFLEENIMKFPGAKLFKENLEEGAGDKTMFQIFQDKLKEKNLDFQNDLKPALGNNAYFIISDLSPIKEGVSDSLAILKAGLKSQLSGVALNAGVSQLVLNGNDGDSTDPQVLGESVAQFNTPYVSPAKKSPPVLDFIVAAEIKDLKKAQDLIAKFKAEGKYAIAELKYGGYSYYKISVKNPDNSQPEKSYDPDPVLNYKTTYNIFLGGNWIMASSENDLKKMVNNRISYDLVRNIFSKNKTESLATDSNYQKIAADLNINKEENLGSFYLKVNFEKFFKMDKCSGSYCYNGSELTKYPPDILTGAMFQANQEGLVAKFDSNKNTFNKSKNSTAEKSLARLIPEKIGNAWTDIFAEQQNIKDLYYDFKQNNLTAKGLADWDDGLVAFQEAVGVDFEKDVIDLFSGSIAVTMFSAQNAGPQAALVAEISDPQKMLGTINKIIDAFKKAQIITYEGVIKYEESYLNESDPFELPLSSSTKTVQADPKTEAARQKYIADRKQRAQKSIAEYKSLLELIKKSQLAENNLPEGKIYSYKIELPSSDDFSSMFANSEPLAVNFSLENNKLIFSMNSPVVAALMKEFKSGTEKKLADNDLYKKASSYNYPENISGAYVNSLGIWNTVGYFMNNAKKKAQEAEQKYCADPANKDSYSCKNTSAGLAYTVYEKQQEDMMFAVGAIIRTFRLLGFTQVVGDNMMKYSSFINIQELPKEEKDRAEQGLNNMFKELNTAGGNARVASWKSNVASTEPAAILCCDDGGPILAGPGAVCGGSGDASLTWPDSESLGKVTIIQNCSKTSENFSYRIDAPAKLAGSCSSATCTQDGCNFDCQQ